MRGIKNCLIPMKSVLDAAPRLALKRLSTDNFVQGARNGVFRVPKLAHTGVRHPCQRASTRRGPVSWKDGLPNGNHAHAPIRMPSQHLLNCGGPPQTDRSCRRQKQHQAWCIRVPVKGALKFTEIRVCERDKRVLAGRDMRRTPQVPSTEKHKNGYDRQDNRSLLHFPVT